MREGRDDLNILFCGDDGVCKGIYLSTLSILKNTDKPISVHILTACVENHKAITREFKEELQQTVLKKNKENRVYLYDITTVFNECLPVANIKTRFTPLCMLRLFADEVKEIPDKILYLDTDVLCRRDFSDFYEQDISNIEILGVPDRYGKWFFGNIFNHDYLNSGVLLMNMANIRKSDLFKKCRKMCTDKKMFMPDQTSLNKLAKKQKTSKKYNCQGKIKSDTVFKHFTTFFKFFPYIRAVSIKPWHIEKMHSELKIFEFDDILNEYQRSLFI